MVKKDEKVFIQIDDKRIELTGTELEAFEANRKQIRDENALFEAEDKAKQEVRKNAIKKLAKTAGLTDEEIQAII